MSAEKSDMRFNRRYGNICWLCGFDSSAEVATTSKFTLVNLVLSSM